MKPGLLSIEELVDRYSVILRPPRIPYATFSWDEALDLDPSLVEEFEEFARWQDSVWMAPVGKKIIGLPVEHKTQLRLQMKDPEPLSKEMIEARRFLLSRHIHRFAEQVLPEQGFTFVLSAGASFQYVIWQREDERLITYRDPEGWGYTLASMSEEEWDVLQREYRTDDQVALLADLSDILEALDGDGRYDRKLYDRDLQPIGDCYPPFPEYLEILRNREPLSLWKSAAVDAFLDEINDSSWDELPKQFRVIAQNLDLDWR